MNLDANATYIALCKLITDSGYTVRKPGYLTFQYLPALGLVLHDPAACAELPREDLADQIHVYLYVQSAPLSEVDKAFRKFRKGVKERSLEDAWADLMSEAVTPWLGTLIPKEEPDRSDIAGG